VASGPAHSAVPHSLLFNTSSLRSILYSFLSYFLGGGGKMYHVKGGLIHMQLCSCAETSYPRKGSLGFFFLFSFEIMSKHGSVLVHTGFPLFLSLVRLVVDLVPNLEEAVPAPGADRHAVLGDAQAGDAVVVARQHACSFCAKRVPDIAVEIVVAGQEKTT